MLVLSSAKEAYVMLNFMRHPDWAEGAQVSGKTLFLSVSVRGLWKRLAFESVGGVKKVASPAWAVILQAAGGLNGTQRWRERGFTLIARDALPLWPSGTGAPGSWAFGPRLRLAARGPWSLGLQTESHRQRSWTFSRT